ncbi:MAG: hypothetical protein NT075_18930 [Chloroflexi bacterium]|nr:hypothetical protein [Chloroflexota bacterium]
MLTSSTVQAALTLLEQTTGVVIPVYFHADTDLDFGTALLGDTVHMFARELADPSMICLSVDGQGVPLTIAQRVASALGTRLVHGEQNHGKLAAVRNGMAELLHKTDVRYLAAVDQDGDHFANELLNFVRCAEHVEQMMATDQVLVLGNRLSRHRPLGFLRGEQEELANYLLLDALHYAAVVNQQPLPLQFANTIDNLPDFHSGYKFFSRRTAEAVFLAEPQLAGCDETAYYRHACEAVMSVEAMQSGAILATVNRRTFDEQPISIFARLDRSVLAANMIIWPCKRLGVPGPFVAQWLVNHMPKLLLGTLAPQGRDELLAIRDHVLRAFEQPIPVENYSEIVRPRFI